MEHSWQTTGDERSKVVQRMFSDIASNYDAMNSIISLRFHHFWRRKAVSLLNLNPGDPVLDVCCGTGDFCKILSKTVGSSGMVLGLDFCIPMLNIAAKKLKSKKFDSVTLIAANALEIPCKSSFFKGITIGWGARNVPDNHALFREMARVTQDGGRCVCIDMAKPTGGIRLFFYKILFQKCIPILGAIIGKKNAYTYLPYSVDSFPSKEELCEIMKGSGWKDITITDLAFGAVCIHKGVKA